MPSSTDCGCEGTGIPSLCSASAIAGSRAGKAHREKKRASEWGGTISWNWRASCVREMGTAGVVENWDKDGSSFKRSSRVMLSGWSVERGCEAEMPERASERGGRSQSKTISVVGVSGCVEGSLGKDGGSMSMKLMDRWLCGGTSGSREKSMCMLSNIWVATAKGLVILPSAERYGLGRVNQG